MLGGAGVLAAGTRTWLSQKKQKSLATPVQPLYMAASIHS